MYQLSHTLTQAEQQPFSETRIVSIWHDGREVVRIDNGIAESINPPQTDQPILLEIYWDGVLMYRLRAGVPEINKMKPALEAMLAEQF